MVLHFPHSFLPSCCSYLGRLHFPPHGCRYVGLSATAPFFWFFILHIDFCHRAVPIRVGRTYPIQLQLYRIKCDRPFFFGPSISHLFLPSCCSYKGGRSNFSLCSCNYVGLNATAPPFFLTRHCFRPYFCHHVVPIRGRSHFFLHNYNYVGLNAIAPFFVAAAM